VICKINPQGKTSERDVASPRTPRPSPHMKTCSQSQPSPFVRRRHLFCPFCVPLLFLVCSLKRTALGFEPLPSRQPPPLPAPLSRGLLSSGLFVRDFMPCRCHRAGCPSSTSLFLNCASCRCLVVLCLVCLVVHYDSGDVLCLVSPFCF
jgi:hypothetical protein